MYCAIPSIFLEPGFNMQQFKLTVTPIPVKRLELIQTLQTLLELFRPYCEEISLTELKKLIIITGTVKDVGHLRKMADSKEFKVLNGALSLLAERTDFNLKGDRQIVQDHPLPSSRF